MNPSAEVTHEEFELASESAGITYPQQPSIPAPKTGTEDNNNHNGVEGTGGGGAGGPQPTVGSSVPRTPSFRVPFTPLQPRCLSPGQLVTRQHPGCLDDFNGDGKSSVYNPPPFKNPTVDPIVAGDGGGVL